MAATIGYRVIHALGRVASVICALAFVYLGIRLLDRIDLTTVLHDRAFHLPMFLLAISLSASWQLAFGPYVADYSRYLPRTTSARATFWWTLGGSALGSQLSMTFGVLVAATAGDAFLDDQVGYVVGLGGAGLIASFLYFTIALGKLTINVLNTYGGFMSMVTGISGFRGQKTVGPRARALYIGGIMVAGTAVALAGKDSFLTSFKDFLLFLLTFFTPWSRDQPGRLLPDLPRALRHPRPLRPDGRYGAWRWDALSVYVVGVLAQLPFLATSFYTGPLVGPARRRRRLLDRGPRGRPAALFFVLARRRNTGDTPTARRGRRLRTVNRMDARDTEPRSSLVKDAELKKELDATLHARRELGPDYESALVDSFLEKVEQRVDGSVDRRVRRQLAEQQMVVARGGRPAAGRGQDSHFGERFGFAMVSLILAIPLSAIGGVKRVTPGLLMTWLGIVAVNAVHAAHRWPWHLLRRPREDDSATTSGQE